jgi:hypothetical protein
MPFQTDTTKWRSNKDEPLAVSTTKVYKDCLNRLAKDGYDDAAAPLANQSAIIKHIDAICKSDHQKRVYLSAIFKELAPVARELKAEYIAFFDSVKPAEIKANRPAFLD